MSRSGKPLAQSYVRRMLGNSFFAGLVRWQGKEYPGRHPVLIPQELFAQVQAVIRRRHQDPKAPLTGTAFPLKVVAACASCRGHMTAELHGSWGYYRCCRRMENKDLCPARLCNVKVAHLGLQTICQQLRLSPELSARIEGAAAHLIHKQAESRRVEQKAQRRKRAALIEREMTLTKTFVDGQISPETYQTLGSGLRIELKQMEQHLGPEGDVPDSALGRVRDVLAACHDVWDLFGQMTPTRQVELLRMIFAVVVLGPEGVVGYVLREPFHSIFGTTDSAGHLRDRTADVDQQSERLAVRLLEQQSSSSQAASQLAVA